MLSHYNFYVCFSWDHSGIHTNCHFNSKIYATDGKSPHKWCTDSVQNYMFDEDMLSFGGDNIALTLNAEGDTYTIKSAMNEESLVNVSVKRSAPGFAIGRNGTSNFGTDPENPWGSMRHVFWPRCQVEGTIVTPEREIDFKGLGVFVHALQGMKPHHLGMPLFFPLQSCTGGRCVIFNMKQLIFFSSCTVEFRSLPIPNILCGVHGVHHASFIRLHRCECWWHCKGR